MSNNKIIFQEGKYSIGFDNGILSSEANYIEIFHYQELTENETRQLYETMKKYYESIGK